MALIKFGGGVIQMSGSIAGNTFARNRYGNYSRARTKPTNPNTTEQQEVRAALSYLTEYWAETLTAPKRTAWNLYASNVAMTNRLGESINLSGFNHFIRSNAVLARFGGTVVAAGPVDFTLPETDPNLGVSGTVAAQQLSCSWDDALPWADENGAFMYFYQGIPQNGQRNFFGGPWKYLGGVAGVNGAPPPGPSLFTPKWALGLGQRQWIYARIYRVDGRISTPFRADCIIAAA